MYISDIFIRCSKFIERNGQVISAFHDIPLFANRTQGLFNMIVEMPRWTNAKNEASKKKKLFKM